MRQERGLHRCQANWAFTSCSCRNPGPTLADVGRRTHSKGKKRGGKNYIGSNAVPYIKEKGIAIGRSVKGGPAQDQAVGRMPVLLDITAC
eukprot:1159052-Pelagomonas_calceolata.AAC.9